MGSKFFLKTVSFFTISILYMLYSQGNFRQIFFIKYKKVIEGGLQIQESRELTHKRAGIAVFNNFRKSTCDIVLGNFLTSLSYFEHFFPYHPNFSLPSEGNCLIFFYLSYNEIRQYLKTQPKMEIFMKFRLVRFIFDSRI